MTIESNLQSIAESLASIATYLTTNKNVQNAPTITPDQVVPSGSPVIGHVVTASAVAVPVPSPMVMPAVPVFTPAASIPPVTVASAAPMTATTAPFDSKQSMMDYVLATYKALGAEKGAKIQNVLVSMGYNNINDVPSEKWADMKVGIEALK